MSSPSPPRGTPKNEEIIPSMLGSIINEGGTSNFCRPRETAWERIIESAFEY